MPFAGYEDFAACVAANQDKRNPEAYCAVIMRKVEKHAAPIHPGTGTGQEVHGGGQRADDGAEAEVVDHRVGRGAQFPPGRRRVRPVHAGLPEVQAKHEAPYGESKPSVWDVKSLSLDSGDAGDLHNAKRRWFITQSNPQVWEAIDTALDQSADSNVWDRTPLAQSVERVFSGKMPQSDLDKGVALQRQWTKMVWERIYGDKKTIPVLRVEGGPHAGKMTGLVSYAVPENRLQLERMAEWSGGKLVESVVSADDVLLLFWGEGRFRSNYVSVKGEVLAWEPSRATEIGKHAQHDQKDHGNWASGYRYDPLIDNPTPALRPLLWKTHEEALAAAVQSWKSTPIDIRSVGMRTLEMEGPAIDASGRGRLVVESRLQARAILHEVEKATPVDYKLWRAVEKFPKVVDGKVSFPRPFSTTSDKGFAESWTKSGKLIVFARGTKAWDMDGLVPNILDHQGEHLVVGDFRVVRQTTNRLYLEPVEEIGKRSQVAALLHKHYGPGPHPSGSPQTIHRGGMSVGTQPTLIPGDEHPKPRTKVSFRLSVKPDFVAGSKFGPASRDFTAEEKSAINLAVEEFESAYPGLLPESLTFAFYNASEPVAAWTWTPKIVRQGGDPSTVFVNEAFFGDISELKRGLEEFNAQAISVTGIDDPDAARTRIIFHELVHIAENHVDAKLFNPKGPSWDSFLPYYSGEWYANRIPWDSELLPSAYATESKSEYLAESLSDVWYHGDKAAPMSKLTVHQFRLLIEGKLDEARDNAWGWRNKINEILREDEDSEITEGMLLSQLGVSA